MADRLKSASTEQQVRLMIWAIPRTASTVLAKCLSHVEDSLTFFEPFLCAHWFGPDMALPKDADAEIEKKMDATEAELQDLAEVNLIRGFDESQCTYKWLKEQFEAPHTGKKFIFCKDMIFAIIDKVEFMPTGYRHLFLIRHPLRVFPSWKKLFQFAMKIPLDEYRLDQIPNRMFPPGYGFKEMSEFIDHGKEVHDREAIIIDADDLLQDPKGTLSALFQAIGLPFDEKILHWDAGEDICKEWVQSKLIYKGNQVGQYYKNAFASTCFLKPSPLPDRSSMSAEMLQYVDASMPYYEKMHAQRLKPTAL